MVNIIYGIDINSDFSALEVRDAILDCFKKAHDDILELTYTKGILTAEEVEKFKRDDIKMLVEKAFEKTGGDYNNPTKESLIEVIKELKQFAINFRAEEVANKNFEEIMVLINKLK